MRWWHFLLFGGLLAGCATVAKKKVEPGEPSEEPEAADDPEVLPADDLYVFVHDYAFIQPTMAAARRIEAASGIKIHVNEAGSLSHAIPVYGSDFLCGNGVDGRTTATWIALARNCKAPTEKVILHELLHKLGVGHLALPLRGIMNHVNDEPLDKISADDLNALCAVRACTKFQPEV